MDARAMDFEDGSFECVIDKGTLDAVLVYNLNIRFISLNFINIKCGEGSVTNAHKMLSEIHRALTAKGVYIMISYGTPEHRLTYLQKVTHQYCNNYEDDKNNFSPSLTGH